MVFGFDVDRVGLLCLGFSILAEVKVYFIAISVCYREIDSSYIFERTI